MSPLSFLIRKISLPLYLKHIGQQGQLRYLDEFARYEKLSSYRLSQIQIQGLKRLLNQAYSNSPYYGTIFRDIGATPMDIESIEDLRKFPVLTKELIRARMKDILAENYPASKRAKAATGGSTGQPLVFWRDHKCRDMKQAMHLNFKRWYGYSPGDKQLFLWGASQDYDQNPGLKARLVRSLATRSWFVNIEDLKEAHLERTIGRIRKLQPDLVLAYPNIIYAFAQRLAARGVSLKLAKIVCSAEQLFDYQRTFLQDVFKAEIFEKYGSREIGTIASECRAHQGMHYFAPGLILESIDSHGNPAGAKLGQLLVTDLWNYAMPLIRYQVGDLVQLDYSRCPCGCELPKIARVAGRVVDVIVKPNGEMIAGQALIAVVRESEIDGQAQVIQKERDKFVIRYAMKRGLPENKIRFIQSSFDRIFGQKIKIDFVRCERLERDKSGKFRYITSEVESPYK
jgi:phenylacetate-CoA ligase